MFWEKKRKNKGLPELPPAPMSRIQLPPINRMLDDSPKENEINRMDSMGLPKLYGMENQPFMKINEGTTQLPQIKERMPKLIEIEESENIPQRKFLEFEGTDFPKQEIQVHNKENKHSIFVKIDKFKTARGSLGNVEDKLEEINDLFKKLKEIKVKEDNEIDYLEKELQSLKNRIRTVTEEIFDKSE